MPYDETDDEDWYDDDDEPDDGDPAPCPECGRPIPEFIDKCPTCGYWLLAADRRALRPGESRPRWIRFTAVVVLATMLIALLLAGVVLL